MVKNLPAMKETWVLQEKKGRSEINGIVMVLKRRVRLGCQVY